LNSSTLIPIERDNSVISKELEISKEEVKNLTEAYQKVLEKSVYIKENYKRILIENQTIKESEKNKQKEISDKDFLIKEKDDTIKRKDDAVRNKEMIIDDLRNEIEKLKKRKFIQVK